MESYQKNLKLQSRNQRRKESILEEGNTRGTSGKMTWEFLKGVIFLICLSLFTFQSLKFYFRYTSHPIRTNMLIANLKTFKLPAITICNRSAFPRSQFCSDHPDICQKPYNLEEFCQKRPILCKGNVADLKNSSFRTPLTLPSEEWPKGQGFGDLSGNGNETVSPTTNLCSLSRIFIGISQNVMRFSPSTWVISQRLAGGAAAFQKALRVM
ncbi:hypothetical protein AVEN_181808-1 [Araneus ventricosus]|uniref:Uncharacterized protein n=1 Tax=Araneus ventricosus TaxID=182803 RepID=A0A4Y2MN40_ARAVE|nr:hypothetical protein AVEN_181808-1 [Araneus ventricosus]